MKKIIFLILCTALLAAADSTNVKVYWLGKPTLPPAPLVALETHQWKDTSVLPIVSIGPGIQTLTFSLDNGAIGVFDILTPINVVLNLYQKQFVQNQMSPINFCFWAPSLGFLVTKPSGAADVTFGISLIPYQIRISSFSFGIGAAWVSTGKAEFHRNNFFITLPLTYNIDIGS
jgi:hypothetical protein